MQQLALFTDISQREREARQGGVFTATTWQRRHLTPAQRIVVMNEVGVDGYMPQLELLKPGKGGWIAGWTAALYYDEEGRLQQRDVAPGDLGGMLSSPEDAQLESLLPAI